MIVMVLPEKETYTLDELFNNLPISLRELGRMSNVNKVTIYGIMYKKRIPYRSTINRLLEAFSKVYQRELTWDNVTGIPIELDTEQSGNGGSAKDKKS